MKARTDLPSRNDVELAIECLEIEDAREKEALRAFWNREREGEKVSVPMLFKVLGVILIALAIWLLAIGLMSL